MEQGCELDQFLTEFKRYLLKSEFKFEFSELHFSSSSSSSAKMTEFSEFEFAALDFIRRNGMNK